ncbi:MAG TPA: hypothetical protein VJT54_05815 [Verrucomicrobiae bacterium]|nr:hypothetical protein [Verrucomicrobiae bacterium]
MSKRAFLFEDGHVNLGHRKFEKALRIAHLSNFPPQNKLETPLDRVLWALWVVQDEFGHRLPIYAEEISEILEIRGIALDEIQVERALARAGARVKRKILDEDDGKNAYKIMEVGKAYLSEKYASGNVRALVLDGSKPWSDRYVTAPEIAKELTGPVCVLDKFYGDGSLAILHHLRHCKPLQFLTAQTNDNHNSFVRELQAFKKECPSVEVRIFPNKHELHDRYFLSQDTLVILGHGIKDLGNKESFVIVLKGAIGAEMRRTLQDKFDVRWNMSAAIV